MSEDGLVGCGAGTYEVLFREAPAWLAPGSASEGFPYPGDYAGLVVAVRPRGHGWGAGDLSGGRRAATLSLTCDELQGLRNRDMKLECATGFPACRDRQDACPTIAPVTFDDRWGAAAGALRSLFADPEAEEREAEREKGDPDLAASRGRLQAQGGEPHPFVVEAERVSKALAPVVAHTGQGLYEVGEGKPYSTIQAALDQLWADQGSAEFTAAQEIRVYAGTYNETVQPNPGLFPRSRYHLIINAADGAEPVVTGTGLNRVIYFPGGMKFTDVDGFRITGTPAGGSYYPIDLHSSSREIWLVGCVLDVGAVSAPTDGAQVLTPVYGFHVQDCDLSPGGGTTCLTSRIGKCNLLRRCAIRGYNVILRGGGKPARIEACTIRNVNYVWNPVLADAHGSLEFLHNTVYGVAGAVISAGFGRRNDWLVVFDSIFHTVNAVIWEVSAYDKFDGMPLVTIDRNCYHAVTKYLDSMTDPDVTTFEAWQAKGYDLNGMSADPKLADPSEGDFSLLEDSPCRHAGAGAGVVSDVEGAPFDQRRPDVGAWSSGEAEAPSRPAVEVTSVVGNDVTVLVEGDPGVENTVELVRASTGLVADSEVRTSDGEVTLTAPEAGALYQVVATAAEGDLRSLPSAPAPVFVSEGEGPHEAVRLWLVAALRAHAGLAETLGLDETGAVPVYASHPPKGSRLPCVVYGLTARPDAALADPSRWEVELAVEARAESPALCDVAAAAVAEAVMAGPHEATPWSLRRLEPRGETSSRDEVGAVEVRRQTWALVTERADA